MKISVWRHLCNIFKDSPYQLLCNSQLGEMDFVVSGYGFILLTPRESEEMTAYSCCK